MMRRILWIAVMVVIALAELHEFSTRPVEHSAGVIAPDAPLQTNLSSRNRCCT